MVRIPGRLQRPDHLVDVVLAWSASQVSKLYVVRPKVTFPAAPVSVGRIAAASGTPSSHDLDEFASRIRRHRISPFCCRLPSDYNHPRWWPSREFDGRWLPPRRGAVWSIAAGRRRSGHRRARHPGAGPRRKAWTMSVFQTGSKRPDGVFRRFFLARLLALVWPAAPTAGGYPNSKPVSAPGPRVFETYKSLWEVFPEDGVAPDRRLLPMTAPLTTRAACRPNGAMWSWRRSPGSTTSVKRGTERWTHRWSHRTAAMSVRSRSSTRPPSTSSSPTSSICAAGLPDVPTPRPSTPVLEFPTGSIAAEERVGGRDGAGARADPPVLHADGRGPPAGRRRTARRHVGLVGLHIVQKTPAGRSGSGPRSSRKTTSRWRAQRARSLHVQRRPKTPMPAANPLRLVPLAAEPVQPFNVTRFNQAEVHTRTDLTNYAYQALWRTRRGATTGS